MWFRERLYVSTTRDNLVTVKLRYPVDFPIKVWPVRVPNDVWDLDLRAQIWRYDPASDEWTKVFTAPLATAPNGREAPLSIGFRAMSVFQGASDEAPAIYAPTHPPQPLQHLGSSLVRTFDGERFETVPEIGANLGLERFRSFRTLLPFKGRLFTAPVMLGSAPGRGNVAGVALVLCSADPGVGKWEIANEGNFGDPSNVGVFEMGVANGFLYAGVVNLVEGFQVWKTAAEGSPPYQWTRVLSRGAFRGRLNQGAVAMTAFGEYLYLSAAIQGGGYDRVNNVGPAAAELLRIAPDDSWDVVAGDPRSTPHGMKLPVSGYGAGFNNPFAGYLWRLCEHDGWLYVGSFDSSVFLSWHRGTDIVPAYIRNVFDEATIEGFLQWFGGFDLWRSRDGVRWTPVSTNGLGNRFNYGARTMASTPWGLFLGATNPFGPEVAVRRAGGWVYEENERGGAEVWLGNARPPVIPAAAPEPALELREMIAANGTRVHDAALCEALVEGYYGGSSFRHFGYWDNRVADAREACECLVEELLSFLPEREGTILDVGCGRGATTAYLLRSYPPAAVSGVCADKHGFRAACRLVPGVRLLLGVPDLALADDSVHDAICAEGIAGLSDKRPALCEVRRVLRPGGRLVLADVLFTHAEKEAGGRGVRYPMDAAAYEALLVEAGFVDVRVVDATYECWTRCQQHRTLYFGMKAVAKQVDGEILALVREALPGGSGGVSAYVLAVARKPEAGAS